MLLNTVLVVSIAVLTWCQASEPTNSVDKSLLASELQTVIDSLFNNKTTTSNDPAPINDTDIEEDNFQPFKVDKRDFFDWKFMEEVFTKETTNVIISPFSVKLVLAHLYEAADAGSYTKAELDSVFYGLSSASTLVRDVYHDMLESLKAPNTKYTLNLATKMFLRKNITPRPMYEHILKDKYFSDIQSLDFDKAEESADTINKWCSNVTEGRLKEIVMAHNADKFQEADLLLINAIYFDGTWRRPFTEPFETVFFRLPSEQVRASFMTVIDKFYYFYSTMWNAEILRLPYEGKKFSMTIILPGAKGGLEELIRYMEGDGYRRIQWLMTEQEVKVTIPKFKFDFSAKLKDTLKALGLNEIFKKSAALSGIAEGTQLKVTDVIQKAGIEVHEKGSTAFAVTEIEIVNKFGGENIVEFNANRPFIFFISDEKTNTVLFAGKVLDPRQQYD